MRGFGFTRKNLRVIVPVALGAILASVLIISLVTETFPLGPSLKSTTLIWSELYVGFDNDFLTSAVENILGEEVTTGLVDTGFYLEAPVDYSDALAADLRDKLVQRGVPEDAISVMELGPWLTSTHLKQLILAVVGALLVLGFLALVFHRRRRIAWSMPLIACLNVIDILGLMVILRVPFGLGSLLGVLIILVHTIHTNALLISRIKVGEDPRRKAGEAAKTGLDMTLGMLIFFGILAALVEFPEVFGFSVTVMMGSLVNLLNTSWLNAEMLIRGVRPPTVKYHVGL